MKFYNREKERELMELLNSKKPGFLVITGRRRVGKTELIKKFIQGKKALYYFVDSNKSIEVLMREFGQYTTETLGLPSYVRIDSPEALSRYYPTSQVTSFSPQTYSSKEALAL